MNPVVQAALIGGPPTAAITAFGVIVAARIGRPNGRGNVAQMGGKTLVALEEHGAELAEIKRQLAAHTADRRQHPPTWRARLADALDPKVNA